MASNISNSGTLQVVENNNTATTISGTVTNTGTIKVEDNSNSSSSRLNLSNTVNNNSGGVITLVVSGGSQSADLDITGVLNNNSGATLQTLAGNGSGSHTIAGEINNAGAITTNRTTTFSIGATDFDNLSGGTFTVAAGTTAISGSANFNNAGTISVASALEFGGTTTLVHQTGGTYTGAGTISFGGGTTFQMNAAASIAPNIIFGTTSTAATWTGAYTATLSGTTTLNKGTVSSNITNSGTLQVVENNNTATTVSGTVTNTGTIKVEDTNNAAGGSTLILSGTVNNNSGGTISLTVTGGSQSVTLDLTGGTLNNNSGATLQTLVGNGVGTRNITGTVNNSGGTIGVNYDLNYQSGTLTNTGVVNVAAAKTLTLASGTTLTQGSGGSYTGGGTINISAGATFQMNAAASIASNIIFGNVSTAATWTGSYTASLAGTTTLNKGTVASNISNSGTLQVVENNNTATTISGTVTNTGTIKVEDTADSSGSTLNLSNTVNNNSGGVITLLVSGGVQSANLDLTGGVLNNNSGATLQTLVGNGAGSYTITGQINNAGAVVIDRTTAFTIGNTDFANLVGGQLTVNASKTLSFTAGGTGKLDIQSSSAVTINGTLNMNGHNIQNAGDLNGSGTVNLGGGTYSGGGTNNFGMSPGRMTFNGNVIFTDSGKSLFELGGRIPTQGYDQMFVAGNFQRGGILQIVQYAAFVPLVGDNFDIMNWTNASGQFTEINGLDQYNGIVLDTNFTDHGLTLMAKAITLDGTDGSDQLIGTAGDDVITGRGGDDVLDGGLGDDVLLGGVGNDVLKGGAGSNHLIGGEGEDTADYSTGTAPIHADLYTGTVDTGDGTDTVISIEKLIGTNLNDFIVGNGKDNVIAGGLGDDTLTGGGGNDVFVLRSPNEAGDNITDFTTGHDVIELKASAFGFAPDTQIGGCFTVIGGHFDGTVAGANAAFAAGQSALIYSQADHALYFDNNGAADGYTTVVTLQPGAILAAGDMRLTDHLSI